MDTIISRSKFWVVAKDHEVVQKTLKLVGLTCAIAYLIVLIRMPTLLSIGWLKPPALAGDFDLNVLTHARLGGYGFDDFNRQHPDYANPPA